jgi:hypothetical protein
MPTETTAKRQCYSLTFKLAVIKSAKATSNVAAARTHKVDESMVRRWRRQEVRLIAAEKAKTYRGGGRSRLSGGGRSVKFENLEDLLFQWIVAERQQRRRVTRKTVKAKAKLLHAELALPESFEASSGWCANFFQRYNLATRIKTHQGQKAPTDLIPKLTEFLIYLRKYFAEHPSMTKSDVFAMDETAVWFDATSGGTVDIIGSRTVSLASTGHEKMNVTVALTGAADGSKRLPYIVFKGKGKTKEDKELQARRDIVVAYSDNGWFNSDLTCDWMQLVMGSIAFSKRLLIWDSYKCHTCDAVKNYRRRKNIDCAIIPSGCTGLIQAPDVSWNKPFKASIREQYDDWLANGEKTYTAAGNMRAVSKTKLCDMVVKAWRSLSVDLIANSFECCGQIPNVTVDKISPFKDGRPAAEGRARLQELFMQPPSELGAVNAHNLQDEPEDELLHDALVLGENDCTGTTSSEDTDIEVEVAQS